MPRNLATLAISATAGCALGAAQVVRENQAGWDAAHATLATMIVQTGAGALIGGIFVAAIMAYVLRRSTPSRRMTPGPVPRSVAPLPGGPLRPKPSLLRRAFILLFATGLLGAGAIVLLASLEHPTVYGLLRGGAGGAILMALGGFLVWDDFIAPHLADRAGGKSPSA